jgi:hypothetical protein
VHPPVPASEFVGFRFPPKVIVLAVRWYLRFALSYRDIEELLAEHGLDVDHVTIYRWDGCSGEPIDAGSGVAVPLIDPPSMPTRRAAGTPPGAGMGRDGWRRRSRP